MRRTLGDIGKRSVRKYVSITSEMDNLLNQISIATEHKLSPAELLSLVLDMALMKNDKFVEWLRVKYVDADRFDLCIIHDAMSKKRVVRAIQKL
jgi:hypothetical protein